MTRNERIAERIWQRYETYFAADGDDVTTSLVCEWFQNGDFDDLLGPEVTEEVLEDLAMFGVRCARRMWSEARLHVRLTRQSACQTDLSCAMRCRRLAKFMRALEKSVSK